MIYQRFVDLISLVLVNSSTKVYNPSLINTKKTKKIILKEFYFYNSLTWLKLDYLMIQAKMKKKKKKGW